MSVAELFEIEETVVSTPKGIVPGKVGPPLEIVRRTAKAQNLGVWRHKLVGGRIAQLKRDLTRKVRQELVKGGKASRLEQNAFVGAFNRPVARNAKLNDGVIVN